MGNPTANGRAGSLEEATPGERSTDRPSGQSSSPGSEQPGQDQQGSQDKQGSQGQGRGRDQGSSDDLDTGRLSAPEIFHRVTVGAREELRRPLRNLAFSGMGAGLAMGISGLGVAAMHAMVGTGPAAEAVAFLLYPLGFVVVIIGRQQLFTENTLFPVAVVLAERRRLGATARLWAVVLVANVVGTLLFAWLAQKTPAVPSDVGHELVRLGAEQASRGFSTVFWTGIVGGWLVALVAWLVTAADSTSGQFAVIVGLTYVIGAAHASHSIAGSAEVLNAVLGGDVGWGTYGGWLLAAVLGNAVGGVVMVALFNYGQVHRPGGTERARAEEPPES